MESYHDAPTEQGWFDQRHYENVECPECGTHVLTCRSIISRANGIVVSRHRDRTYRSRLELLTVKLPQEFVLITFRCDVGHSFAQTTTWSFGRESKHVLTGGGIFREDPTDG